MDRTRIFYITRANLSLKRAHSHNILKTVEALSKKRDLDITLVIAGKLIKDIKTICEENNITDPKFRLEFIGGSPLAIARFLDKRRDDFDVLYTRELGLWLPIRKAKKLGKKIFFELHRIPIKVFERIEWQIILKNIKGIIAITNAMKNALEAKQFPVEVAHCAAAEPELFDYALSKGVLRGKLNLPQDKFLVCSMGTFTLYHMESLYQGLALSDKRISLVLLGAKDSEVEELKSKFAQMNLSGRIIVRTRVPYRETPDYLLASDALVVPEGKNTPGFAPTKIYEYLAAGRPIISYKNEAILEVLEDGKDALLISDPTPQAWKNAFNRIISDEELRNRLSKGAIQKAAMFGWQERAEIISRFVLNI